MRGKTVIQRHGDRIVVQNPPMPPLTTAEMDAVYALPFMRTYHPSYEALGGVPGIEEVKFSIIHNRGCFGACNFCSLAYHQGRQISCRSHDSVLAEAKAITAMPDFKGYIHDVGGPTANFRRSACDAQQKRGVCADKKCLAPAKCPAVTVDHSDYLALLRKLRALPRVKKVFIRSGIRFDYLIADKDETFFKELVEHHVSGQLKVAPEHCSENVLRRMGKPPVAVYERFKKRFYELTERAGKKQYLVPYLMSSHPGSTLNDAIELALFLKKEGLHPEQVQDFYPTPGTVSTCMGSNPTPWRRSTFRVPRRKRRSNAPCSNTSAPKTVQSCSPPYARRVAPTLSARASIVWSLPTVRARRRRAARLPAVLHLPKKAYGRQNPNRKGGKSREQTLRTEKQRRRALYLRHRGRGERRRPLERGLCPRTRLRLFRRTVGR